MTLLDRINGANERLTPQGSSPFRFALFCRAVFAAERRREGRDFSDPLDGVVGIYCVVFRSALSDLRLHTLLFQ